ncbi:hypothetical protein HanIR_Chr06g0270141 [Helianthus annuus]|nr:hypothetical protein HanIR_Chr06g0270141 [Helianthus annuus]
MRDRQNEQEISDIAKRTLLLFKPYFQFSLMPLSILERIQWSRRRTKNWNVEDED